MLPRTAAGKSSMLKKKILPVRRNTPREGKKNRLSVFLYNGQTPWSPQLPELQVRGPLTTPRDETCPAQRTGQQLARARETTSTISQNSMYRITLVRLLADILNRYTLISKQKVFLPASAAGYRVKGSGFRVKKSGCSTPILVSLTLNPESWPLSFDVGEICFQAGQKCPDARRPTSRGARRTLSRTLSDEVRGQRRRWAFFTNLNHR
jgi:hypothetical protein